MKEMKCNFTVSLSTDVFAYINEHGGRKRSKFIDDALRKAFGLEKEESRSPSAKIETGTIHEVGEQ